MLPMIVNIIKGVGYDTYNYRLNLDVNLTKTTQVHVGATGYMSVNDRQYGTTIQ